MEEDVEEEEDEDIEEEEEDMEEKHEVVEVIDDDEEEEDVEESQAMEDPPLEEGAGEEIPEGVLSRYCVLITQGDTTLQFILIISLLKVRALT